MNNILGLDIGGVIIDSAKDDTFLSENYLTARAIPGAFEALASLREEVFGSRIYLVSKASEDMECRTYEWLKHYHFYELTGIPFDHVYFCSEGGEKAGICNLIGVTHFVDNRLEVLAHLRDVPHQVLFRPTTGEMLSLPHRAHLGKVHVASMWNEVSKYLARS